MDVIRKTSDDGDRYYVLEAFWRSQVNSKAWMVDEILNIQNTVHLPALTRQGSAFIFGGWHGLTAMFIRDHLPNIHHVFSIDVDSRARKFGRLLSDNDPRITFITDDMVAFFENDTQDPRYSFSTQNAYRDDVSLIVNTSTEHVSQDLMDRWLAKIPKNVLIVIQGNDFHKHNQHVRSVESIEEFNEKNPIKNILFTGTLDCVQFNRFMTIGYNE